MDDILHIYYALGLDDEEWDDNNEAAHDAVLAGAAIYLSALGNQQHRSSERRRLYLVRNELLPLKNRGRKGLALSCGSRFLWGWIFIFYVIVVTKS